MTGSKRLAPHLCIFRETAQTQRAETYLIPGLGFWLLLRRQRVLTTACHVNVPEERAALYLYTAM